MDALRSLLDLFLHLDKQLTEVVSQYGTWTYGILFLIIFLETGLVVTPFLPGDSLLFAAGAIAATTGKLDPTLIFLLLSVAAILGDTVNYWIGYAIGPRIFDMKIPFLKREHLDRTHAFYEKHGGKTIILARFIPIIRTFAPFVAGMGKMSYGKFITYNVVGGIVWVALLVFAGYFFGNMEFVKKNFELVIFAIIIISIIPAVFEYIQHRRSTKTVPQPEA